jgi:hypothetical protein
MRLAEFRVCVTTRHLGSAANIRARDARFFANLTDWINRCFRPVDKETCRNRHRPTAA